MHAQQLLVGGWLRNAQVSLWEDLSSQDALAQAGVLLEWKAVTVWQRQREVIAVEGSHQMENDSLYQLQGRTTNAANGRLREGDGARLSGVGG